MITCSAVANQLAPIYQQPLDIEPAATAAPGNDALRELETMLGVGLLIYQNIRQRHLAWYADVEANQIAYDVEDAQRFADEYVDWLAATKRWLAQVERLEHSGCKVARADEIRQSYDELRLVNLSVRELVKRYKELERGGGIEAGEFFASLRNRETA